MLILTLIWTELGLFGCSCSYTPYTNFQEFLTISDIDLTSPNAVRLSSLVYQGQPVEEWWQFRGFLVKLVKKQLKLLKMDKQSSTDFRYVLIVDDQDVDLILNSADDIITTSGALTDQ